jgi:hypothetical protein
MSGACRVGLEVVVAGWASHRQRKEDGAAKTAPPETVRRGMRNRTLRVAAISIAASAVGLASVLTTADATKKVTITSHISITAKGLKFSGKVTATNAACKTSRKVTLYRKLSKGSSKLGSTTTNASGSWKITVSGSAGITMSHFYAKVAKTTQGTAGTIYVCTAATSSTIAYKP